MLSSIQRSATTLVRRRQSRLLVSASRAMQTRIANDCDIDYKTMFLSEVQKNESLRDDVVNKLAFSSDADAFKQYFTPTHNEGMTEQLRISNNQLRHSSTTEQSRSVHSTVDHHRPLPTSMPQVLAEHEQAIVITENRPPFQIVHVNDAWEGLCGWSMEECRGKTLSLLQGHETDLSAVTSLMNPLLRGEEGGVVLTNYTKEGRRFRNHLRVGPLELEGLFVGVLQEIHDEN